MLNISLIVPFSSGPWLVSWVKAQLILHIRVSIRVKRETKPISPTGGYRDISKGRGRLPKYFSGPQMFILS